MLFDFNGLKICFYKLNCGAAIKYIDIEIAIMGLYYLT